MFFANNECYSYRSSIIICVQINYIFINILVYKSLSDSTHTACG